MILVWRICTECGRKFSFRHKPGELVMSEVCTECADLLWLLSDTLDD